MTAAHCVVSARKNNPDLLGHVRLHVRGPPARFNVTNIHIHPQYVDTGGEPKWDFAILQVNTPVPASLASPAPLNIDESFLTTMEESAHLTVLGFGFLEENAGKYSKTLQEVTMSYIPNAPLCSKLNVHGFGPVSMCCELCYRIYL